MVKQSLTIFLLILVISESNGTLSDFLSMATDIAGALGTESSGQFERGKGCTINWSYKGQMIGFKWKYIGICSDSCTKEVETVFYNSRAGSIEHCLENLYHKIARHGDL
ncbi:uncharacterized protein LOC132728388 [Ruditapes philippinarum]|uniref:uncharacterized protein LOC132728388 n=1 Tax=Ruditapes philippinarum TaxID=129788 RepID=UPI00295AB9AC|nr:uncharacterized protein LOC132728388 [Ruditapes philippinarum]XP_060570016.1 uncharacterized protein LOC132728388 [Ruditapes philippinarum]